VGEAQEGKETNGKRARIMLSGESVPLEIVSKGGEGGLESVQKAKEEGRKVKLTVGAGTSTSRSADLGADITRHRKGKKEQNKQPSEKRPALDTRKRKPHKEKEHNCRNAIRKSRG